jgi:hypothetical protein
MSELRETEIVKVALTEAISHEGKLTETMPQKTNMSETNKESMALKG